MHRNAVAMLVLILLLAFESEAQARTSDVSRERTLLQIQKLIEDHALEQARRLLAQAAKDFPNDPGFDNLRGVVEAQTGNYSAAANSFAKAVDLDPKFTSAYLNLGRLYQQTAFLHARTADKALQVYRRVLAYDPENPEANYQSAVLLLQQQRYQGSLEHVALLPAPSQASAQTLSVSCADYAALRKRESADQACEKLIASPDVSDLDAQQALPGLIAGKRDDLIISLLERVQLHHPLSSELQRSLGSAYERRGSLRSARATLDTLATQSPSVPLLLELTGIAHRLQDYRGALGYLAHARDLDPDNASIHYDFGWVCLEQDLIAEARISFQKAVQLDPANPSYNYAMGVASAFRQDPEDAVPYFRKYLRAHPQDSRGKLAIGFVFWRAKNFEAAIPWLKEAVENARTAPSAHYYLGAAYLSMRRPDVAFDELQLALKTRPEYPDALAELGKYYLQRKEYDQAESRLQSALRQDPDHYSANFYLLTLYAKTGDARREAQAKRFEEVKNLAGQRAQELLRIVEVRPFDNP